MLLVLVLQIPAVQSRQLATLGFRFGEAAHPGPELQFRLRVTNPTCVSNKFDSFVDLLSQYQCNIISMSETAATELVQKQLSHKFNTKKCKTIWSPLVQPLTATCGPAHTRGKASGVGLLSNIPCRNAGFPVPDDLAFSTRFVHTVVQLGDSHVQIVVLYCKPNRGAAESEFNSKLMRLAVEQTRLTPLPFIIMGDFNMPVNQFDVWPQLRASGCLSLTDIYPVLTALKMPPSCMEATNPDNAILSPSLVPFIKSIRVLPPHLFAAHRPVVFDLHLPSQTIFMTRLRHPRSFVELSLEDDDFEVPGIADCFNNVNTIEQWGEAVEACVNCALRAGGGNVDSLLKAFRGKCKPLRVVKCPINSPIKEACPSSYNPSTEVLTMATRRKVTQVRRLESLYRRLCKSSGLPFDWNTHHQLLDEWRAIVRCHAFGTPFFHWLGSFPDMDFPSFPLPSKEWVFESLQISRHYVEIALQHDKKVQAAKAELEKYLDKKAGNRKAFARIRGPGPPPVLQVAKKITMDSIVVTQDGSCQHEVYASADDIALLSRSFPVLIGNTSATISDIGFASFMALTSHPVDKSSQNVVVQQEQIVMFPHDVAASLSSYWKPIWQRDPAAHDFQDATPQQLGFDHFLQASPAREEILVTLKDPLIWQKAIQRLRASSARGTDSISAQEFKMLPAVAIQSLATLLSQLENPFDTSFMTGLVAPLSKAGIELPSNDRTRPITILPQFYRLWASVICLQIAAHLHNWAPPELAGFLPGRGAVTAVLQAQHQLEWSRWKKQALLGLVLDLRKCFNCFRISFCYHAMKACGIPVWILDAWVHAQASLCRYWLSQGHLIEAGFATTGCPEGDQLSVIAMVYVSIH